MKKYENFCRAFKNLKEIYDYREPYGTVDKSCFPGRYD